MRGCNADYLDVPLSDGDVVGGVVFDGIVDGVIASRVRSPALLIALPVLSAARSIAFPVLSAARSTALPVLSAAFCAFVLARSTALPALSPARSIALLVFCPGVWLSFWSQPVAVHASRPSPIAANVVRYFLMSRLLSTS